MPSSAIPRPVLVVGLAAMVPFVWGAVSFLSNDLADFGMRTLGPRFVGPYVQLAYGTVILAFSSGVLWGFAARAGSRAPVGAYELGALPALWAFFVVGGGPVSAAIYLIAGYLGLLGIDWLYCTQCLAPRWWLRARATATAIVVASLLVIVA